MFQKLPSLLKNILFVLLMMCSACPTILAQDTTATVRLDTVPKIEQIDSLLDINNAHHYLFKDKKTASYAVEVERPPMQNETLSFYAFALVLIILGILRVAFPGYFRNMSKAILSPTLSGRQLKDQMQSNAQENVLLNAFFCISLGLFIYAVINFQQAHSILFQYNGGIIIGGLVILVALTYLAKYLLLKFLGWIFKISNVTDVYIFNVFLVNKLLGIALLPFSIVLTFGEGNWLNIMFLLSLLIVFFLILNRYTRSWSSVGSFFQYSKLHFFLYFCASELLPLAILIKFITNWLL